MMEFATNGLVFISWIASAVYVVAYGVSAPWWRTTVGRSMMGLGVSILAVSSLATVSLIFGQDFSTRPIIRLFVWSITACITLGLCLALYRAQLRKGK
jgi:hypothetical protein